ncbi:hypothetical protein C8Q75DRAFT_498910 [Abortiporus biennis]|nr:hypothetical protein C8Q75DRAFT_498910 [Abortiporus biennis]
MGPIDLSACTSLQSLTFSIILDDGLVPKAVAGLYTYMIDIIKTTQSTPLSHIHFEYNFVDFVPLTSMSDYLNRVTDFIKFDETLGSIPQLNSVTISTAYIGRTDGYDSPMLPPVNLNNRQVRTTFLDKLSSVASTGRLKFVPMYVFSD